MEGCIVSGMLSAGLLFSITPEFNFFKIRTGAIITLSIIGFLVSSIVELLAFWVYSDDLMVSNRALIDLTQCFRKD